jgi:hypothetical protein
MARRARNYTERGARSVEAPSVAPNATEAKQDCRAVQGVRNATATHTQSRIDGDCPLVGVILHFQGEGHDRRRLAAVPQVGSYLREGSAFWRVDAVVFDRGDVRVYATAVSVALAAELQTAWSRWGKARPEEDEPAELV